MIIDQSIVRNVIAGSMFAGGIAFGSVQLSAFWCSASTGVCGPGTELHGYEVSCVCEGEGACRDLEHGFSIECACDGFPVTYCDCDDGCS